MGWGLCVLGVRRFLFLQYYNHKQTDKMMTSKTEMPPNSIMFYIPHADLPLPAEAVRQGKSVRRYPFSFAEREGALWIVCNEGAKELLPDCSALRTPIQPGCVFLEIDLQEEDRSNGTPGVYGVALVTLLSFALGRKLELEAAANVFPNGMVTAFSCLASVTPHLASGPRIIGGGVDEGLLLVDFLQSVGCEYMSDPCWWQAHLYNFLNMCWLVPQQPLAYKASALGGQGLNAFCNTIAAAAGMECRGGNRMSDAELHALSARLKAATPVDAETTCFRDCLVQSLASRELAPRFEAIFRYAGGLLPEADKANLSALDKLLYPVDDALYERNKTIAELDASLTHSGLLLILAMLGYRGSFISPAGCCVVADELPFGERLKLSAVKAIARKLLGQN